MNLLGDLISLQSENVHNVTIIYFSRLPGALRFFRYLIYMQRIIPAKPTDKHFSK